MDLKNDIAKRIKINREKCDITQEQLAERSELSASFIAEVETGKKNISALSIVKLCQALDITADYLIFGDEPPLTRNKMDELLEGLSARGKDLAMELVSVIKAEEDKYRSCAKE